MKTNYRVMRANAVSVESSTEDVVAPVASAVYLRAPRSLPRFRLIVSMDGDEHHPANHRQPFGRRSSPATSLQSQHLPSTLEPSSATRHAAATPHRHRHSACQLTHWRQQVGQHAGPQASLLGE